jgi:hypothetical protein
MSLDNDRPGRMLSIELISLLIMLSLADDEYQQKTFFELFIDKSNKNINNLNTFFTVSIDGGALCI